MIKLGPLSAVAYGDAYNARFEYRKGDYSHLNTGDSYGLHPTHKDIKPGYYTDDAQLNLANGELLIAHREAIPARNTIAQKFLDVYARDPHVGYSKGMLAAIKKADGSGSALIRICAENGKTEKSGAAMRATVLGVLPSIHRVREYARYQGSITHEGDALLAAEGAALAAHYMLYSIGPRSGLPRFLSDKTGATEWETPWHGPVGSLGMESTRAAITSIVQATSLRDLLIRSGAWTGDVDTVGAIAMGAGWRYLDLPNNLPDTLREGLENGPYGRDYLEEQDPRLLAAFA